jgi:hypothetical protein
MAALVVAITVAALPAAAQPLEFKQLALTEPQIKGFINAQKDITAIAPKLQAAGDKIDAALQAELEGIAKKHGFKTFAELDDVAANISMVMAGLDPQSGEYTDPIDAIKKEIADIEKDAAIPEKDKKQMLEEMNDALKTTPPLQFRDNIQLVKKFQKEIEVSLQ